MFTAVNILSRPWFFRVLTIGPYSSHLLNHCLRKTWLVQLCFPGENMFHRALLSSDLGVVNSFTHVMNMQAEITIKGSNTLSSPQIHRFSKLPINYGMNQKTV